MPPEKVPPSTGFQSDGDGAHPRKTAKLSQIRSDPILSGSSSLQALSIPAKQVYTILSEDDDEENQFNGNYKIAADDVQFKNGSLNSDDNTGQMDEEVDTEVSIDEKSSTNERLQVLLAQAGPVTISFFLGFSGTFTNLIFASHFVGADGSASTVFAGVSLANMFANVSCMSLLIGTKIFEQ